MSANFPLGGMTGRLQDNEDMDSSLPKVRIDLWRADAVVLFDWLMTVDLNEVPIIHPAEKQALMDLLTRLEVSDVTGADQAEIDAARADVAHNMGW